MRLVMFAYKQDAYKIDDSIRYVIGLYLTVF